MSEHEHKWGAIEHSRFTATPHRKCTVADCRDITLDLEDHDCEFYGEPLDCPVCAEILEATA